MPIALPRSSSGKAAAMIASVAGVSRAAPIPLADAGADDLRLGRGEAAEERRAREDRQPGEESALPPEEVSHLAARQEK
jgi:hypothetical protein